MKETKLNERTETKNLSESSAPSAAEQKQTDKDFKDDVVPVENAKEETEKQETEKQETEKQETEKQETEKQEMKADENTKDQEEDEQEKTLTPAQHLELLRETELALFRATFNHKKVSKRGEVALTYEYWLPCFLAREQSCICWVIQHVVCNSLF